jgi:hypothetical protein
VFGKAIVLFIIAEGGFVFFVPYIEPPASLSNIRFITIRAGELVGSGL